MRRSKISRRSSGNRLGEARAHEQVSRNVTTTTSFPRLLTTDEAAAALRVHARTLMRLASDPKSHFPEPRRVRGRTLLARDEVLAYLQVSRPAPEE